MNKIANHKEVIYDTAMEKIASRAWKRNLGKIGEKGVDKLIESGVFNRNKELKGLRRGTQNILKNENAKMLRNPEHFAGHVTRGARNDALKHGYQMDADDIAQTKKAIRMMGPGGTVSTTNGKGFAHVKKNAYKEVRGKINSGIDSYNDFLGDESKVKRVKPLPRKDRDAKKWTQAIFERHEADEVRFGNRIINNKKKTYNTEFGPRHATVFGSHLTPKVLAAESANVALAPKATQDRMKHIRNYNASITGHQNTEMGALKAISGKRIQYGESGVFDRKGANKAEKQIARNTKQFFED